MYILRPELFVFSLKGMYRSKSKLLQMGKKTGGILVFIARR